MFSPTRGALRLFSSSYFLLAAATVAAAACKILPMAGEKVDRSGGARVPQACACASSAHSQQPFFRSAGAVAPEMSTALRDADASFALAVVERTWLEPALAAALAAGASLKAT